MKKLIALLLAGLLVLSLVGCNAGNSPVTPEENEGASDEIAFSLRLTINPGFQLYYTKIFKCVKIEGINDDGIKVSAKVDVTGDDLDTSIKEVLDACNRDNYFQHNNDVKLELGEVLDDSLNGDQLLEDAREAVDKALKELEIDAAVEMLTTTTTQPSTTVTKPSTTTTIQTTIATTTKRPTAKPTAKPTVKPTAKPTAQPTAPVNVNPSNVKLEEEYVGKVYFRYSAEEIYAPGICFYNDGGFGEGIYCLLLDAMFTSNPDDDIKDRTPVIYNNVKYYRCGSGMSPAYVEMTEEEIVITKPGAGEIKAVLLSDGNLKITKSADSTFPVNTVLSISWNYLSK